MSPSGDVEQQELYPWQQIVSSCSGAVVTSLFMTPLDVVKVRLQAEGQQQGLHNHRKERYSFLRMSKVGRSLQHRICARCEPANAYARGLCHAHARSPVWDACTGLQHHRLSPNAAFTGTLDAMIKISRLEGLASLWSGLSPTLLLAVPATVCYFTLYDHLRDALYCGMTERGELAARFGLSPAVVAPLLAGSISRVTVATIVSPLEMAKTKIQSEKLSYRDVCRAISRAVEVDGCRAVFRGLGPTVLRDVPFSGIYWLGYETCKVSLMKRSGEERQASFGTAFVSGALAGSFAALVTLPFDVVKTQRQVTVGGGNQRSIASNYGRWLMSSLCGSDRRAGSSGGGTMGILLDLQRRHGIRAWFRGATPRLAKVTPACAIMIGSYEYGKNYFRSRNARHRCETGCSSTL